jgi:Bacterial Ig domain
MELLIVRQPAIAAFSGNPMVFTLAITPYSQQQISQDLQVVVSIEVEQTWMGNTWNQVSSVVLMPDSQGNVKLDVSEKINAYLSFFTPPLGLNVITECREQSRRYRLTYYLANGSVIIIPSASSTPRYAIKGGTSAQYLFAENMLASGTTLLTTAYEPATRTDLIQLNEYRFVYLLARQNLTLTGANTPAVAAIGYNPADNATFQHANITLQQWKVYCIPVSLATVFAVQPTKPKFIEYNCIAAGAEKLTAQVDHRPGYAYIQLLYRNSMGGLDSIMLRGDNELEQQVERQQATLITFTEKYALGNLKPQLVNNRGTETIATKANTAFIPRWKVDALRDLLLSEEVYQIQGDRLLPIVLLTNRTRLYGKTDDLYAVQLEWLMANPGKYFSPMGTTAPACPLPLSFVVRQSGSRHLDIMWHLQDPYTQMQVEITIGSETTTLTFFGASGRRRQTFNNTATGTTPLPITIRAHTMCNPYSSPISTSGWVTINMDVFANQAPTAINDVYNINSGYSVPVSLTGSVLANDSDPDGDALTVTAQTNQPTNAGGTYSITTSGIVTYTPPSSAYVGQDYFDYTITEAGGGITATARVFINVGTQNNGGFVFVRLEEVDVYQYSGVYTQVVEGKRRARFYSDPAGTQSIDPSALGLTLNMRAVEYTSDFSGNVNTTTTNYTEAANAADILIYTGVFLDSDMDPFYHPYEQVFSLVHSIQPGTGYIVL